MVAIAFYRYSHHLIRTTPVFGGQNLLDLIETILTGKISLMVKLVSEHEQKRKKKEGRTANLSIEDQILMTLEYYREYRTLFHIGTDYGLDESNVQRTVVKIESILIESGHFNLPGKKVLLSADKIQTILTDATETPTARPKKSPTGSKD
jgi:hypothetical protein